MRLLLVALAIASLTMPAHAQRMSRGKQNPAAQQQTEALKKKNAAQDRAYKSALDRIPNQKPADPWGVVR